jgi:hypothetical protein
MRLPTWNGSRWRYRSSMKEKKREEKMILIMGTLFFMSACGFVVFVIWISPFPY